MTTFLLKNRNASSNDFVLQRVNQSEAIFFAGGDQSTYVNFWQVGLLLGLFGWVVWLGCLVGLN